MDFPVNKLKVEEKLQLLEALVPASNHNSKLCNTNETAVSSREWKAHVVNVNHDNSGFACQFCDKIFCKRSDLRSHLACHLSLKLNVCEICGRSFGHVSNLIRHTRLHSGVKPYPCNVCDKRFTQVTSLNQHKISYHSSSLLSCPALPNICTKVFRTPFTAKQHAFRVHPSVAWENSVSALIGKRHRKKRSYFCRTCGKEFQKIRDLKIHVSISKHFLFKDVTEKHCITKSESLVVSRFQLDKTCKPIASYINNNHLQADVPGLIEVERNVEESKQVALYTNVGTSSQSICTETADQMKWRTMELGSGICEDSSPLVHAFNRDHCLTADHTDADRPLRGMEGELWLLDKLSFCSPKLESDLTVRSDQSYNFVNPERRSSTFQRLSVSDEDDEGKSGNSDNLNQVVDAQANLLCSEGETEQSYGDILQQKVNDMDSSGIIFDINYKFCLDSDPATVTNQELLTSTTDYVSIDPCEELKYGGYNQLQVLQTDPLHAQSGAINNLKLKYMARAFENSPESTIDSFPVDLHEMRSIVQPELSETLIVSFGESYSALLKEIGISEDATNATESEENFNTTFAQESAEPLLPTLDHYSVLIKDAGITDAEKSDEMTGFVQGTLNMSMDSLLTRPYPSGLSNFVDNPSIGSRENCWYPFISENKETSLPKNETKASPTEKVGEIQLVILKANQMVANTIESQGKPLCIKQIKEAVGKQCFKSMKGQSTMSKNKCPECGKTFFKSSNLSQHLGLHFPSMRPYKCCICNQTFSWKSSLNKHTSTHSLPQFLCDICGIQYKSFDQIQQHKKRDHDGMRPNTCRTCNKSYFRKHDLKIHERIHSNEKPYMCDECGKTFNHLSHLKRHKSIICSA